MQIVEKALNELKKAMLILQIGDKLFNALLIFTLFLLLFNLLKLKWYYSFVPSLGYLIGIAMYTYITNIYLVVEGKVPEMKEQLRTVADNVNKSNEILDSLKQDVIKNMRKVKTSYFMDFRRLGIRVLMICVLAFIIVLMSFFNVKFEFSGFDLNDNVNEIGIRNSGPEAVRLEYSLSEGNLSDILGNKSLAELGKKEFKLEINPLESDADLSIISNADSENDFSEPNFPKEIYTRYDVAYNEKIAKENQDVVRNYFEEIIGDNNG